MKKIISILFASLIILSGMHLTMATHFCGGKIFATKFSVSGEKVSCGMETSTSDCSSEGAVISSDCCKDEVATFSVDNDYQPSSSFLKEINQNILQVLLAPVNLISFLTNFTISPITNAHPPDVDIASAVSLAGICVFRI